MRITCVHDVFDIISCRVSVTMNSVVRLMLREDALYLIGEKKIPTPYTKQSRGRFLENFERGAKKSSSTRETLSITDGGLREFTACK